MFNLLPQLEQEEASREYRFRLAGVVLICCASLSIATAVALSPSLFLSYQIEKSRTKEANSIEKEITLNTSAELASELKFGNAKLSALSANSKVDYSHDLVERVVHNKTVGIKIFGIDVKSKDDGSHDLAIIGLAQDRETLLSFVRVLEGEKGFTHVTVPVSNFAPVADINFSILVKAK